MDDILKSKSRKFKSIIDEDLERTADPTVSLAMQEEIENKRAKKLNSTVYGKREKGKTLSEVEEEEGGSIQESKVGMAATLRSQRRKKGSTEDETELPMGDDLINVEEALSKNVDDGIQLEPFNLAAERQTGYFDEGGNYVENKVDEDDDVKDAWLNSCHDQVLEEKDYEAFMERQKQMQLAEEAPQITSLQAANIMRKIIPLLKEDETIKSALRRLKNFKGSKVTKLTKDVEVNANDLTDTTGQFDTITEAAMTLLDAGELDIYDLPKEDLERKANRHPAEADGFDMFAEETSNSNEGSTEKAMQLK